MPKKDKPIGDGVGGEPTGGGAGGGDDKKPLSEKQLERIDQSMAKMAEQEAKFMEVFVKAASQDMQAWQMQTNLLLG